MGHFSRNSSSRVWLEGRAAKILLNSEWREEGAWINTGEGVGTTFGFREEEKEEEEETDPPLFFGAENSGQVLLGEKADSPILDQKVTLKTARERTADF